MARSLMLIAAATFIIAPPSPTPKAGEETLAESKKVERIAITELKKKLDGGVKIPLD